MFDDLPTAQRIEAAETALTRALASAMLASGRAPRAFLRELGAGIASYIRPGSPMNKVIGVGLAGPLEDASLSHVEALMRARDEPTRIELATLAIGAPLRGRGYRLVGFETVLVRSLSEEMRIAPSAARIERVTTETVAAWKQTSIDASAKPDETGTPVDQFSYDVLAEAIEDFLTVPGFDRYLAYLDGALAGAASMRIEGDIALLGGSATLPAARRQGVQTALITSRLIEARERGAELAVVTTAPDSRSQANMLRQGFSRAYARAIWVRD